MQVSSLTRSLAQMEEQLRQASEDRVSKMNYRADTKKGFLTYNSKRWQNFIFR